MQQLNNILAQHNNTDCKWKQ